jgi:hypothetical protein
MNIGMGVMINALSGTNGAEKVVEALGKTITYVGIEENELRFRFDDASELDLFDDGQSCCEHRYMNTDDDLAYFVGAVFQGVRVQDGGYEQDDDYGDCVESQFLLVDTNKGTFTVANYNSHNGYYGGFWIVAK